MKSKRILKAECSSFLSFLTTFQCRWVAPVHVTNFHLSSFKTVLFRCQALSISAISMPRSISFHPLRSTGKNPLLVKSHPFEALASARLITYLATTLHFSLPNSSNKYANMDSDDSGVDTKVRKILFS